MKLKFLKFHTPIFLLAISIGILTLVPQLIAVKSIGDDFNGIYPVNGSDDLYYAARVKDITDGHTFLQNPYIYEHKDSIPAPFWIPDYIIAQISETLFKGNIHQTFFFLDFLLLIILTILTYSIVYLITKERLISLLTTSVLHLGLFLDYFNRSPSPQLNFIFFLTLFILVIFCIQRNKWLWFILAGLNLGALFYIYPYYWSFYLVLIGLLMLSSVFFKKDINYIYKWLSTYLIGGLLGIPYIISNINVSSLSEYTDTMRRLGMIETHFPSGIGIILVTGIPLAIFAFLWLFKRINLNQSNIIVFLAPITLIIVSNHHIITGRNLEFSSHYWMQAVFVSVFLIAYLVSKTNFITKKYSMVVLSLLVLVLITPSISSTVERQAIVSQEEVDWQQYGPVLEWLNNNTESESVVLAEDELSSLIPIYTQNNVFYTGRANLHYIVDEEVYERFLIVNFWEDIDHIYLIQNERLLWRTYYINRYNHNQTKNKIRKVFGVNQVDLERLPDDKIDEVLAINSRIQRDGFTKALQKYRVDYIVVDSRKGKIDFQNITEPVSLGAYDIYKLN